MTDAASYPGVPDDANVGRDLAAACRASGFDLGEAIRPDALADYLETAHAAELWSELPRLSELAERVANGERDVRVELVAVQSSFEALRSCLESHLMREEQIVFPLIREILAASQSGKRPNGTLHNPIDVLDDDHERIDDLLDGLSALTDTFAAPDEASAELRDLYDGLDALASASRLHMRLENLVLFPTIAAIEHELLAALEG